MEFYIIIVLIALVIKLICTNIKLKMTLEASKQNMMALCELMLNDDDISREEREKIVKIYMKLKGE